MSRLFLFFFKNVKNQVQKCHSFYLKSIASPQLHGHYTGPCILHAWQFGRNGHSF